jgi:hypothetical protein
MVQRDRDDPNGWVPTDATNEEKERAITTKLAQNNNNATKILAAAIAFLTALAVAVEDVRGDFAPFVPTELACSMGKISSREENRASNSTSKAESSHNSLTNARNHFSAPAHCDSQMTDNGQLVVPEGSDVGVIWSDTDPVGSPFMIGCVSNRFTAVCRYVVVCRLSVIMFLPFNVKIDFLAINSYGKFLNF